MIILDGKSLSTKIKNDIKLSIQQTFFADGKLPPKLAIVLVGESPASLVYIAGKLKACDFVGIKTELFKFNENVTEKELSAKISQLNADDSINGILVQLPLPEHICAQKIVDLISPQKDVDGLSNINLGKVLAGDTSGICGCTPRGIIALLKEYNINLVGKDVVIINRSNLVGKPLAMMFLKENSTVTICHSKTKDLKQKTLNADIVVVAVGKENFLTADMVKEGAIVVDVGTSKDKITGKTKGDVDFENVSKKASYISPVPHGIGPMTIAMLLKNTFEATNIQNKEHN
jgi:methylenetetrahydrofolate dehydrogenase (NADP+)/methenyltetrahydrofolate cyclohydrolase